MPLGQRGRHAKQVAVRSSASLFTAARVLVGRALHRLPVMDSKGQSVVAVVTLRRVLRFLVARYCDPRRLYEQSVRELGMGTWANLATVSVTGASSPPPPHDPFAL